MKKSEVLRMELNRRTRQLESYAKAYEDQVQRYKESESANETLRKRIIEQIAKLADVEKGKQELRHSRARCLKRKKRSCEASSSKRNLTALDAMEKESKARFEVTTREREELIAKLREELVQSNEILEKERQETIARLEALESEHSKSKLEADSLRQLNERLLKEYKKTTKEEETHNNEQANTIASLEMKSRV